MTHHLPTIMGYCVISQNVKIAAVRLHECKLLDLKDIFGCYGFSCHTWFQIWKLWCETGNIVPEKQSIWGCVYYLDQENLDYLLKLICDNPDYFLDEFLHLLETNYFISIHYTTIYYELKQLNVSQKKLKKIAILFIPPCILPESIGIQEFQGNLQEWTTIPEFWWNSPGIHRNWSSR